MLIQTSQKRYGEGLGLVFELGKNKNCVDIFLNLEITLGLWDY